MKHLWLFIALITSLGFCSCKDSEGTIGDSPITENGQDRDDDIITGDDYIYHLPVIFHVFYDNQYDKAQYIEYIRLKEILGNVNELFQGDVYNVNLDTIASENVHVVFEMAKKDPNGKTLSTPGVEYIKVTNSTFDCEEFMQDKKMSQYSWNQNDYINVMVYTFQNTDDGSVTLGISNLPYQVKGYPEIEGLSNGKNYPLSKPSNFPYCVSLNATYIDKQYEGTRYTTDKGKKGFTYMTADPNATLAHELGHYLGLFHAFSEKTGDESNSEEADNDEDTDYCTDTPSYNRVEYTRWLEDYIKQAEDEAKAEGRKDPTFSMRILAKRSNSRNEEWQADNLMDYSICYSMRFTPEQVHRMRQVLYYSPLIPGPKKQRPTTRAVSDMPSEETDLPNVLAKERRVEW